MIWTNPAAQYTTAIYANEGKLFAFQVIGYWTEWIIEFTGLKSSHCWSVIWPCMRYPANTNASIVIQGSAPNAITRPTKRIIWITTVTYVTKNSAQHLHSRYHSDLANVVRDNRCNWTYDFISRCTSGCMLVQALKCLAVRNATISLPMCQLITITWKGGTVRSNLIMKNSTCVKMMFNRLFMSIPGLDTAEAKKIAKVVEPNGSKLIFSFTTIRWINRLSFIPWIL